MDKQQKNHYNQQFEDPFSQLMFGGEFPPPTQNQPQNMNQPGSLQNSLQQQLQNVDIESLANNINNMMSLANELGPVVKQLSPLLELFKKK
ncbi:hypothetical protein CIB95_01360 [Lottiidibacillus patelloidae]|uniref:Uncharacterized protein n=1 Tax=Lottiidibacillus patelloidae TaxID=2670334 RepID=A0A263BWZ0_9BACI|nr:hypothetical protein [Lottiidibacillus patelloidae]OZM58249.1 hypothetical protein CIB95_01360 [Lottiidibacillus patelloidae]